MDKILLIDGEPFNASAMYRDMDRRIVRAFRGAQMADQVIFYDEVGKVSREMWRKLSDPTPKPGNRHERRKQAKMERRGQTL